MKLKQQFGLISANGTYSPRTTKIDSHNANTQAVSECFERDLYFPIGINT